MLRCPLPDEPSKVPRRAPKTDDRPARHRRRRRHSRWPRCDRHGGHRTPQTLQTVEGRERGQSLTNVVQTKARNPSGHTLAHQSPPVAGRRTAAQGIRPCHVGWFTHGRIIIATATSADAGCAAVAARPTRDGIRRCRRRHKHRCREAEWATESPAPHRPPQGVCDPTFGSGEHGKRP